MIDPGARRRRLGSKVRSAAVMAVTFVVVAGMFAACSAKVTPPPGELILAVQTDMSLPKDIDKVRILVTVNGQKYHDVRYDVGPNGAKIPATLAIVVGHNPAPVTVKVIGERSGKSRILRQAVTSVPTNRLAVLKMPIHFLCDASAKDLNDADEGVVSTCTGANEACVQGQCVDSNVPPEQLPNFVAAEVYGGGTGTKGDGACFDTLKCFDGATDAQLDLASCTLARPADPTKVNLALRLPPGKAGFGICSADLSLCVVPLDAGATGWSIVDTSSGPRIQLPTAACDRIKSKAVVSVLLSSACASKTDAVPTCGPWSSTGATTPATSDAAAAPSCTDGVMNGNESDVDCGGSCTTKCADTSKCATSADCANGFCNASKQCAAPTCSDGQKNGSETDVDCGGARCPACPVGLACAAPADCVSSLCGAARTCDCPAGMTPARRTAASKDGYCVDATEVTNLAYAQFLSTSPSIQTQPAVCKPWNASFVPTSGWPATGKDNLPVAFVDWCDASAFCSFANKRLCGKVGGGANAVGDYKDATKSQWYSACSASSAKTFPYGSAFSANACNGVGFPGGGAPIAAGVATTCVGGYPGMFDLSGNVSEWEDSCDLATGPADSCRARGGSFSSQQVDLQCDASVTYARSTTDASVGFRCCAF